jgi:hypothetical protein
MAGEVALAYALEQLEGAQVVALVGLAGPFIREPICPLVALNADVGRDPLDVHIPVFEYVIVDFSYSAHECAV